MEHPFSQNSRLIEQIGGCPMAGTMSDILLHIYVCKMGEDTVAASKRLFYKWYVNDMYVRKKE